MDWNHVTQRQRQLIVAGAAFAINAVLLAALAGLFHRASRMPWLAAGDDNAALLARCDRIRGTAGRHTCIEAVIAAVQMHSQAPRFAAAAGDVQASAIPR